MQLNTHREQFRQAGVAVAAVTFDGVAALDEFTSDQGIEYPLLSDPSGSYMHGLGIRNEDYGPDHPAFGIPHPGVIWIDAAGTIRYKAAVPDYRSRPDFAELLTAIAAGP